MAVNPINETKRVNSPPPGRKIRIGEYSVGNIEIPFIQTYVYQKMSLERCGIVTGCDQNLREC